jgi:antitoxin YefM
MISALAGVYVMTYVVPYMTTPRRLPMVEARARLTRLPEELSRAPHAVAVTRQGNPVLAIIPWELYEGIVETLEVLADPELADSLARSVSQIGRGHVVSSAVVRKKLGLA